MDNGVLHESLFTIQNNTGAIGTSTLSFLKLILFHPFQLPFYSYSPQYVAIREYNILWLFYIFYATTVYFFPLIK